MKTEDEKELAALASIRGVLWHEQQKLPGLNGQITLAYGDLDTVLEASWFIPDEIIEELRVQKYALRWNSLVHHERTLTAMCRELVEKVNRMHGTRKNSSA